MTVTWVLEPEVLDDLHGRMRASARRLGHEVLVWRDSWRDVWPSLDRSFVVFHGSLETAWTVRARSPWKPGAFCDVDALACSAWYPGAERWLLHEKWLALTVQAFVDDPEAAFRFFGDPDALFVRPDSPLKPFSGRVVRRGAVTLSALDHGFYYDETSLPIILAPTRVVEREWRFVAVSGDVVAASGYSAATRSAIEGDPAGDPWRFAAEVARGIAAPEPVYVLDVCSAAGRLRLLELNPFSGADLYGCCTDAIAGAIGDLAVRR